MTLGLNMKIEGVFVISMKFPKFLIDKVPLTPISSSFKAQRLKTILFSTRTTIKTKFLTDIEPHNDQNWIFLDILLDPAQATVPFQSRSYAKNHLRVKAFPTTPNM
jgi:hypothetical protein